MVSLVSKVSMGSLVSKVTVSPLVSKASVSPFVSKVSMRPFGGKVSVSPFGPKVSKVSVAELLLVFLKFWSLPRSQSVSLPFQVGAISLSP